MTKHLHDKFDALYDVSVFYEGTVNQSGVRGNAPQLIGESFTLVSSHILRLLLSTAKIEK